LIVPGIARRLTTGEDLLSPQAFGRLARLVHRHSRVRLGAEKRLVLANRLRPRMGQLRLASVDAYARYLETARSDDELEILIDLATTHYTHFFREPSHFAWLASEYLPSLGRRGARCRVWSAAASSGEEAWTLAMLLAEGARHAPGFRWQLDASDISRRVLSQARRAIYPESALQSVPDTLRRAYFERGIGPRTGYCRVQASLRQQVRFTHGSLFEDHADFPTDVDVIFCRNVMIYFDELSRAEAVRRLAARLAPGGHLVIGASESLLGIEQGLVPVHPGIYRLP
jgi:chemotaxis protein methyltransferase CheR